MWLLKWIKEQITKQPGKSNKKGKLAPRGPGLLRGVIINKGFGSRRGNGETTVTKGGSVSHTELLYQALNGDAAAMAYQYTYVEGLSPSNEGILKSATWLLAGTGEVLKSIEAILRLPPDQRASAIREGSVKNDATNTDWQSYTIIALCFPEVVNVQDRLNSSKSLSEAEQDTSVAGVYLATIKAQLEDDKFKQALSVKVYKAQASQYAGWAGMKRKGAVLMAEIRRKVAALARNGEEAHWWHYPLFFFQANPFFVFESKYF